MKDALTEIADLKHDLDEAHRDVRWRCPECDFTYAQDGDAVVRLLDMVAERDAAIAHVEAVEAGLDSHRAATQRAVAERDSWREAAETRLVTCLDVEAERDALLERVEAAEREAEDVRRVLADLNDDVVLALLERVERAERALTKISAIRDSIIGMQGFNFSEHAYPLVAALGEAGYQGAGYEISRANLGTLIEQRDLWQKSSMEAADRCNRIAAERDAAIRERDEARADGYHAQWQELAGVVSELTTERDAALALVEQLQDLVDEMGERA